MKARTSLAAAAVLVIAGALALRTCDHVELPFSGTKLEIAQVRVDVRAQASRIVLELSESHARLPLTLRIREGNVYSPIALGTPVREGARLVAPVRIGAPQANAKLVVEAASGGRAVSLVLEITDPALERKNIALAFEAPLEARSTFVEGVGELADVADVTGRMLVLGEDPMALGVASPAGPITVSLTPDGKSHASGPKIVRVSAPVLRDKKSAFALAVSARSQGTYGAIASALAEKTMRVHGVVNGATPRTRLYGLDEAGKTRVRAVVDAAGRFEVEVPADVNRWYAAVDESRVSPPLFFAPGADWDLVLDVSPGGELVVRVRDGDEGKPMVARLAVRGIEGTLDPSFGPDYRASGAGPLIDTRAGEVVTPVPAGKYRVSATHGIEWTIDAQEVRVTPGGRATVDLRLRHVLATPDEVGCDLHVHARPSFDSPVLPEDRVLSLVAAGIDFAVPTEHNVIGNYGPAIEVLDLGSQFTWVPGVEVTTYTPRFGHFGVFPMELDAGVPPYRKTSPAALFAAAKRDPKRVLQVHHPRLPKDIGYFEVAGFDPKNERTFSKVRLDFDALEVYNGFDVAIPSRVDEVLADYYALLNHGRRIVATGSSDAHRIQYNWAGYPRTMVRVGEGPLDATRIVESLKHGHATVTSGPLIALEVGADGSKERARPGDEIARRGRALSAHVVVSAAPWIDVTEVSLIADGVTVTTVPVASRPSVTGPPTGTLEEARAQSVRYEGTLPVPSSARYIMILARGERKTDDVLAFMPLVPMGFTNPVWMRD